MSLAAASSIYVHLSRRRAGMLSQAPATLRGGAGCKHAQEHPSNVLGGQLARKDLTTTRSSVSLCTTDMRMHALQPRTQGPPRASSTPKHTHDREGAGAHSDGLANTCTHALARAGSHKPAHTQTHANRHECVRTHTLAQAHARTHGGTHERPHKIAMQKATHAHARTLAGVLMLHTPAGTCACRGARAALSAHMHAPTYIHTIWLQGSHTHAHTRLLGC